MLTSINAKMDIRGFLRIQAAAAEELNLKSTPYAELEYNSTTKQIRITPLSNVTETSFRVIPSNKGFILFLKGAMTRAGIKVSIGHLKLKREGKSLIYSGKRSPDNLPTGGEWVHFPCRNSSGLPMVSISTRGTLIFDKKAMEEIDTRKNHTFIPYYDSKKKEFTLKFIQRGFINVRSIASHANASFMGTLSAEGIPLPKESYRTRCHIKGDTVTFSVKNMLQK